MAGTCEGEKAVEEFKINGQYVNTPEKGVVGIPFIDQYVEKAAIEYEEQGEDSPQWSARQPQRVVV